MPEKTYTKQSLVDELLKIRAKGWFEITRNKNNVGNIGNTLEDLLGIKENNLPIPNASEWELKTQRKNTNSLITLFHMEPSPIALSIVPYLVKNFGWKHDKAGKSYPISERSFRQTLSYHNPTVRGFDLDIDETNNKIIVTFNINNISTELQDYKQFLVATNNATLDESYIPYWGFNDIFHKAGIKLKNCFFIKTDEKIENGKKFVKYDEMMILSEFKINKLIENIILKNIYVDFDARTGHNHGTKFRIKPSTIPSLYSKIESF